MSSLSPARGRRSPSRPGLYVGGKQPVVLIQNTGFLESGDAIRGTAVNMEIPLVSIIGYRGYQTLRPESNLHPDSAATFSGADAQSVGSSL